MHSSRPISACQWQRASGATTALRGVRAGGQYRAELVTRSYVQLREHIAQVVGDGGLADENSRADFRVGEAVARQPRDLRLLGSELISGFDAAFPRALTRGRQLALASVGESLGAHAREHLERGTQLLPGLAAAALASQPLAVDQVGAGKLQANACPTQPFDRLAVQGVGGVAVAQQRPRTCLYPERPVSAGSGRRLREPLERQPGELALSGPDGRFNELRHGPRGAISV